MQLLGVVQALFCTQALYSDSQLRIYFLILNTSEDRYCCMRELRTWYSRVLCHEHLLLWTVKEHGLLLFCVYLIAACDAPVFLGRFVRQGY